jgi:hypothetical protein
VTAVVLDAEAELDALESEENIPRCDKPLANAKACCHAEGHDSFSKPKWWSVQYHEPWGERNTRHSHTWHLGDARYGIYGPRILDMETGEVIGDSWADFNAADFRGDYDPLRVLELYGIEGIEMELIEIVPDKTLPTVGYRWSFRGERHVYGVNDKGFSVEFDKDSGKIMRLVSPNERERIVRSARSWGAAKVARKYDLKPATVRQWMGRAA